MDLDFVSVPSPLAGVAKWIGLQPGDEFHPKFKREISLKRAVSSARLDICGVGLYEAYLDGVKVGEDVLAPFFNDYDHALQVQSYDVTGLLTGKAPVLTVLLGNGWYKGRLGYDGESALYSDKFQLIAALHISYADGTCETVATDESWQYRGSDIAASDIYDGEVLDRTLWADRENPWKSAALCDAPRGPLVERMSPPLKVIETIPVKEVIHTPAGETVLDFGQNFAGRMAFTADLPAGTVVTLQCGEVLQQGNFYRDNYRDALARFQYVSGGKKERVWPIFTFMGFRYVKVEGITDIDACRFEGQVIHSEMTPTGTLITGNPLINQLISNARWGLKSNFVDMPTDCPQRNERLGWTGDAQVFAPTASFFMDTRAFYRKFLWDLRADQKCHNGAVAHYIPNIHHEEGGAAVWADAATFIPTTLYEVFGDKDTLAESWSMMKDWVDSVTRKDSQREGGPKHIVDFGFTFGDWLAMDGLSEQSFKGSTEDAFVASVYYYASTEKVARAAAVLGLDQEAGKYSALADKIKAAIHHEYFAPSGRLTVDTQAAYVIALKFGLGHSREALMNGLEKRLNRDGYRIMCGFTGAPLILEVLAENGRVDRAYELLLRERFPGWLSCVKLGATTIWERWNSLLPDGSVSGTGMNSLNHYAYGSVVNFMVRYAAGLRPLAPGYRKALIAPAPNAALGYMDCTYDSVNGRYTVSWHIMNDGTVKVDCTVPQGCSALVQLPDGSEHEVGSGSHSYRCKTEVDARQLYTPTTPLTRLVDDPAAMAAIRGSLPFVADQMEAGNFDFLSLSVMDLVMHPWLGLPPAAAKQAVDNIFALTIPGEAE